jgi:hypothetical protein
LVIFARKRHTCFAARAFRLFLFERIDESQPSLLVIAPFFQLLRGKWLLPFSIKRKHGLSLHENYSSQVDFSCGTQKDAIIKAKDEKYSKMPQGIRSLKIETIASRACLNDQPRRQRSG